VGGQCSAMQTVAVAADELIFAAEFSLRAKLNFPQIYNQSPGEQRSAHTLFKIKREILKLCNRWPNETVRD